MQPITVTLQVTTGSWFSEILTMTRSLCSRITWTQLYFEPSSRLSFAHSSTTSRISSCDMSGRVTLECGWKHITWHLPQAASHRRNSPSSDTCICRNNARTNHVVTKVPQYIMDRCQIHSCNWWYKKRIKKWTELGFIYQLTKNNDKTK